MLSHLCYWPVWKPSRDLTKLIIAAFERHCASNSLNPDMFPTIREMKAEVVAMCLRLVVFLVSSNGVALTLASQNVQQSHLCGDRGFLTTYRPFVHPTSIESLNIAATPHPTFLYSLQIHPLVSHPTCSEKSNLVSAPVPAAIVATLFPHALRLGVCPDGACTEVQKQLSLSYREIRAQYNSHPGPLLSSISTAEVYRLHTSTVLDGTVREYLTESQATPGKNAPPQVVIAIALLRQSPDLPDGRLREVEDLGWGISEM